MITDCETDYLYLSALLPVFYPDFYADLTCVLEKQQGNCALLSGTNNIWCRDYMPVQVDKNKFAKFIYDPSYLKLEKYRHLLPVPEETIYNLNLNILDSNIVLDGGNIIKSENKVIVSSRIFKDNPLLKKGELLPNLKLLLEAEEVIVFPEQPYDYTGHADGLVRFIDDNTVVINDLAAYSNTYKNALLKVLKANKLNFIELPYAPSDEKNSDGDYTAKGCYINYLQMKQLILLPQFNIAEDEIAYNKIAEIFPHYKIGKILCNDIAQDGGVLNCISWNIKANF